MIKFFFKKKKKIKIKMYILLLLYNTLNIINII